MYMIFLYRFDLKENGIDFVLNEQIAADMLPHYDALLRPLVASLADRLQLYRSLSTHPAILTGKILNNGQLKVMLSEELGKRIDVYTKNQIIFEDGKRIADILVNVMDSHTSKTLKRTH
ncbi:hypothetical protein P4377_24425 [Bacillus thuringiensis]|nr:hypothetical protein [Bacillus thuringiensis]